MWKSDLNLMDCKEEKNVILVPAGEKNVILVPVGEKKTFQNDNFLNCSFGN